MASAVLHMKRLCSSSEGVLRGVGQRDRLVVGNILDTQKLEGFKQVLAYMLKSDRAMMRIPLLRVFFNSLPPSDRRLKMAPLPDAPGLSAPCRGWHSRHSDS